MRPFGLLAVFAVALVLVGCGKDDDVPKDDSATVEPSECSSFSISGFVTTLEGVEIVASGPVIQRILSNSAGVFSACALPPGDYTVYALDLDWAFEPAFYEVTIQDRDIADLVFVPKERNDYVPIEILENIDLEPRVFNSEEDIILFDGTTLRDALERWGDTINRPIEVEPLNRIPDDVDFEPSIRPANSVPPPVGPQERRQKIISGMLGTARALGCARKDEADHCGDYEFEADPSDPILKPRQEKITYVWGGRDLSTLKPYGERNRPSSGSLCRKQTVGLDCSGYIYQIANRNGLRLPRSSTTYTQRLAKTWNDAIPDEWKLEMKVVTDGSVENGDIIVWPSHIGLAEVVGSTVAVWSSTGNPRRLETTPVEQCQRNIVAPRGPRNMLLTTMERPGPQYWGPRTVTLRLVAILSGTLDMQIRCAGETSIVGTVRFEIDNEEGGEFRANGRGTDYDGTPLCFTLSGTYEQTSNDLSATLALCDGSRSDGFSIKFVSDDSGFFGLRKIVNNEGCFAQARLIRVQDEVRTTMTATEVRRSYQLQEEASGERFGGRP